MDKILTLLESDAKLTTEQLAAMVGKTDGQVAQIIDDYEKRGIIKAYRTMIDWDKAGRESITALIEVRVSPQRDFGFEQIAERIMQFDEVSSCYLMSGGFDLFVEVQGATFKEVAMFVAERLAPLDNVLSTATHFILRKYKDDGVTFGAERKDERGKIPLC
jgi:DNA-binding Lrp family transcriptional regulator